MICYIGVVISMSMAATAGTDLKHWANTVHMYELGDFIENLMSAGTSLFITLDVAVLAMSIIQFWFGENVVACFDKFCCCCGCFGYGFWSNACCFQWLLLLMFLLLFCVNLVAIFAWGICLVILVVFYVVNAGCTFPQVDTIENLMDELMKTKEFDLIFHGSDIIDLTIDEWHEICRSIHEATSDMRNLFIALTVLVVVEVAFVVAARSNYLSSKFHIRLMKRGAEAGIIDAERLLPDGQSYYY